MWRKAIYCIFVAIGASIASISCSTQIQPQPGTGTDSTDHPVKIDTIPTKIDTLSRPDTTTGPVEIDAGQISKSDSILSKSARFGTKNIFEESALTRLDGIYGSGKDYTGQSVGLAYSFIAPAADTLKKRPFVLLVHEGAFLFGTLDNEMGKATSLAQKGYASASINYRLGFTGAREGFTCGSNSKEVIRAVYRAVQDTYVALRYFIQNADALGIDPAQIFLGGSSAGAITVSSLVYMTEADFEAFEPGISKALGSLDPYETAKKVKVRALLTSLGYGILKSSYVTRNNAKPTLFFQRSGDNVLAWQQGSLFFCPGYPDTFGARAVADQLVKFKVPFELNYEPEIGHLLDYPQEYVVSRYAGFIQRLWKKDNRQIVSEKYKVISDQAL